MTASSALHAGVVVMVMMSAGVSEWAAPCMHACMQVWCDVVWCGVVVMVVVSAGVGRSINAWRRRSGVVGYEARERDLTDGPSMAPMALCCWVNCLTAWTD